MSSSTKCRTWLIPDTPATTDNFSAEGTISPHQKIATAIADLIRSEEDGGKSIGLEGGWGSGKTTIVRILFDELTKGLNYKVVLFDAWAHEGDPLRRTFLETLIERLSEETDESDSWVKPADWEKQKEIIAQRMEIKTTSTDPHIGRLGFLVIPLLALIPIGTALLGAALKDLSKLDFHQPYSTETKLFFLSLFLIVSPLVVIFLAAFLMYLWAGVKWLGLAGLKKYYSARNNKKRLRYFAAKSWKPDRSIWSLLVNKTITGDTTHTNKTTNPTSVEFESYFAKLMTEALVTNDPHMLDTSVSRKRKIVLVLDNLDRISPAEALKILSTLQTFLNPRTKGAEAWQNRVWVLIPYDFEGLSQLWGKEKSDKQQAKATADTTPAVAATPATATPGDQPTPPTENVVALSFLDKSFQLRFEVPPPVLSRWRVYLENLMGEAFPDHKDKFANDPKESEELYNVYTLYAWYLKLTNRLPTPRQLKLYVNQIGAIHRQWEDAIPFSHMAYYVLLKRLGFNVVEMVRKGALPTADVEGFLAPDAALNLSALAFNTTVAEARQIILENPIQESFETRQPTALKTLYQDHQDKGFWEALEAMAKASWKNYTALQVAKAAYCLEKSELFKPQPSPTDPAVLQNPPALAEYIKRYLRKAAAAIDDWGSLDTTIAEGIASLFEIIANADLMKSILNRLSLGVAVKVGDEYRVIDYPSWASAILLIREKLIFMNCAQVYQEAFIENLKQPLLATNALEPQKAQILLECLSELRLQDKDADEALAYLAANGQVLHTFYIRAQASINNEFSLFIFLFYNPQLIKPPAIGLSDEGYNHLIKYITEAFEGERQMLPHIEVFTLHFAEFLIKHNGLTKLFEIHQARPDTKSFVVECLKVAAITDTTPYVFTPEIIEREWQLFSQLTKGEYNAAPLDKLVRRSIEQSSFVDEVCTRKFNLELARLYRAMAINGAEKNPRFPVWLKQGLESLSKETWLADIDKVSPMELILLLTSIPYLRNSLALPNYQAAIVEIAQEINAHKEKSAANRIVNASEATTLIQLVGDSTAQDALRRKIFEVALAANGEVSEDFLSIFGSEISDVDLLINSPETFSGLLIPMLKTGKSFRQEWIAKVIKNLPDLADQHSDTEAVRAFRQLVRQRLKEFYRDKTVLLIANEDRPPTISIPLGRDGEIWMPPMHTNPEETETPPDTRGQQLEVDPITAAFAIQSGWFEESPDSPYSWNHPTDKQKDLATNEPIMEIAIHTGVMPNVRAELNTRPA